jgi:hypothetical protein
MEVPEIRRFVNQDHHIRPKVDGLNANQGSSVQLPHGATLQDVEGSSKRVGLIPVTIRLNPELATALKFAALKRQMAEVRVNTQQQIVTEAIEMWLAANPTPQNFGE